MSAKRRSRLSASENPRFSRFVFAPSDLVPKAPELGARRRVGRRALDVGGRIVDVHGSGFVLADALGSLEVSIASEHGLAPGHLAVVRGYLVNGVLRRTELLWHRALPETAAESEVARLCWSGLGLRLHKRQRALKVIRGFFERGGFLEIDGPLLVRTPGLDAHVDGLRARGGFLCTSPEFHLKRLLVGGVPRLFQLGHCFRADEQGPLHEPEFTMLEWYRAFAGQEAIIDDTEQLVASVVRELTGHSKVQGQVGPVDVTPPFPRLSVERAFRKYAKVDDAAALAERDPDGFFQLLVDRIEPALARRRRPVFLCEFPLPFAALAQPTADGRHAERFELYVGGVELCNGYGELTDPVEQARRFGLERKARRSARRPVYPMDRRFLGALREGLPPAAGNALGVDRLIALSLGTQTIGDVMPFNWRTR